MNRKLYLSILLIPVILTSSCQKWDENDPSALTEEFVLPSYDYTVNRANAVYSQLPNGFLYIDNAMMASACDESEHTQETSAIHKFNTGSWNAVDNPDDKWSYFFSGVRKANQFLEAADSVNHDVYKLNPNPTAQATYQTRLAEIRRLKYEVRFLRAFFYFELVKRYGGVPLVESALPVDGDYKELKRSTLAQCVKFISDECDSAAKELPVTYADAALGRVTKGAALALKSRMLLYAASDLFNTTSWAGGYAQPELISLSGDRMARWKDAADAAKAVLDLKTYTLSTSYPALFGATNFTNKEMILIRRNGQTNTFEQANFPIGYDPGQSGTAPSQNLVDAYEMSDGGPFDWNNPVHAASPYANRDPRLAFSILTNNTLFKARNVESWTGGRDGKGIELASRTGYYLNKYINADLDLLQSRTSVHSWVLFRLAEVYLNYAEALNEYDPGNPEIKIQVDLVRARADVKMPALPANLGQAAMRERIRNERRVELAFEDHRFWDLRRWLQGPEYLGAPLKGVEIRRNNGGTFSYQPLIVENRVFDRKMYLFPIPQEETILVPGIVQNPLW